MKWPPEQIWLGKDVFILGGGPSVENFPISCLVDKNVIGCNDSYKLGTSVVDILIFGDKKWWDKHIQRSLFLSFIEQRPVFTNCKDFENEERVIWTPRELTGFHKHALGWNNNTGSAAINLALVLGASRIFLIGFDMGLKNGKSNWHDDLIVELKPSNYVIYKERITQSVHMIYQKWPNVKIYNLNPASELEVFKKVTWDEMFKEKEKGNE